MAIDQSILVQEPPPSRIIIPTLQVIPPGLGIVVIPAVAEGVVLGNHIGADAVMPSCGMITPSVVRVRQYFYAVLIINRNNIPLQILLKEEGEERIGGIRTVSILHADGGTVFVVQVNQEVVSPNFADDLRTIQGVNVLYSVNDLACANSVGVVEELDHRVGFLHFLELTAVPGEVIPLEGLGVADLVVGNGCSADLGQLIAPGVAIGIGFFCTGQGIQRIGGCIRVGLFARAVAGVVIRIDVSLVLCFNVLADKLILIIVCVGGFLPVSVHDLRNVAVTVVGIGVGRGRIGAGCNHRGGVVAHQRGGVGRGCAEGVRGFHRPARRSLQRLARQAVEGYPQSILLCGITGFSETFATITLSCNPQPIF